LVEVEEAQKLPRAERYKHGTSFRQNNSAEMV